MINSKSRNNGYINKNGVIPAVVAWCLSVALEKVQVTQLVVIYHYMGLPISSHSRQPTPKGQGVAIFVIFWERKGQF